MLIKILLITTLLSMVVSKHIRRFIDKRRKEKLKEEKVNLFHKLNPKDRVYLEGIIHFRSDDQSYTDWKKIIDIEDDFRRLFAMEGVKYVYKRDFYWRTRRKVVDDNVERIVNYKCDKLFVKNSTDCENCSLWTIEESPPCPYEFYSMMDIDKMCGYNYLQNKDFKDKCPSTIKFSDLPHSCDNPMETTWRFTTEYNSNKKYSKIICDGKDYCEIFTTYFITPTDVIFQIMNATNDVIYSRIMKPNNINYVCVNDCGRYDLLRKKVIKLDNPLRLNLLSFYKNKRDEIDFKEESMARSSLKKRHLSISNKKGGKISDLDINVHNLYFHTAASDYLFNLISLETTTMSSCKKIQKKAQIAEDYENYDY